MTGEMKGSSPNPLWRTFGLIHGDQHGNHSDAPARKDATHNEERESERSGLHGNTNGEDQDSKDDGPSPAEKICSGGCEQRAKERPGGQDRDNEGLLGRGDGARSS